MMTFEELHQHYKNVRARIDKAAFIDHCNADPGLLEMWKGQRDALAKAEGRS